MSRYLQDEQVRAAAKAWEPGGQTRDFRREVSPRPHLQELRSGQGHPKRRNSKQWPSSPNSEADDMEFVEPEGSAYFEGDQPMHGSYAPDKAIDTMSPLSQDHH